MKNFDGLDEVFEVESEIVPQATSEVKKVEESDRSATKEQIRKDYEVSRAQLHSLVMKGQEAVDGILDVARASDHPRAYEVAGQLIKNVADTADKLIDLQKKMKELDAEDKKSGPSTVNNTMFIGSTAELQKMLKKQKEINNTDSN